jgi:hypothetical protein
LLHRNIRVLENSLSKPSTSIGNPPAESIDLRGATFEFDTLELARRGRQEQARVMAELISAGAKRLVALARKVRHSIGGLTLARTAHGLKGN